MPARRSGPMRLLSPQPENQSRKDHSVEPYKRTVLKQDESTVKGGNGFTTT